MLVQLECAEYSLEVARMRDGGAWIGLSCLNDYLVKKGFVEEEVDDEVRSRCRGKMLAWWEKEIDEE
jgi:hypothetical protein